jgi:zinc protease
MQMKSTVSYSDYKEVEGIKFPHTMLLTAGPQELKFEVTDIKINDGVTEEDFK